MNAVVKTRIFAGITLAALLLGETVSLRQEAYEVHFCRLVFGKSGQSQVLVSVHGDRLVLLQVEHGRHIRFWHFASIEECRSVEIVGADGTATYVITAVSRLLDKRTGRNSLMVSVDVNGPLAYRQYCDVEIVPDDRQMRVAHFDGPLAVGPSTVNWKVPANLSLQTGERPTELRAVIGTIDEDKGCWVVVRTPVQNDRSYFHPVASPIVEIDFPPKRTDEPMIHRRYALDQFC